MIFNPHHSCPYCPSGDHDISSAQTTPAHTAAPQTDTKRAAEPSYQNIENDNAYLSDEYEPVQEFMIGSKKTEKFLEEAPQTNTGGHVSSSPGGPIKLPERSDGLPSSNRTTTLDNQYVKVTSPARSGQGNGQGSGHSSSDEDCPDHEYQNMPGFYGAESGDEDPPNTISPAVSKTAPPVSGNKSPTYQKGSDSPKPRLKPKPDLSAIPPGGSKQRSTSSGALLQNSPAKTHAASRLVIVGESKKETPEQPHLEKLVFPTRVANGNGGHVVNSNGEVTVGNITTTDNRWRSQTAPVSSNLSDEGDSIEEDTEVLYVNIPDVEGQDLYENVTHLT